MEKYEIDLQNADIILDNARFAGKKDEAIKDYLVQHIAGLTNISVYNIYRKTRKGEVVYARQLVMLLVRHYTTYGLKRIGGFFGKDHTTVIHACDAMVNILTQRTMSVDKIQLLALLKTGGYLKEENAPYETKIEESFVVDAYY